MAGTKDDIRAEHKRREHDYRYFELLDQYHGYAKVSKNGKERGKARGMPASKASRMSSLDQFLALSVTQPLQRDRVVEPADLYKAEVLISLSAGASSRPILDWKDLKARRLRDNDHEHRLF